MVEIFGTTFTATPNITEADPALVCMSARTAQSRQLMSRSDGSFLNNCCKGPFFASMTSSRLVTLYMALFVGHTGCRRPYNIKCNDFYSLTKIHMNLRTTAFHITSDSTNLSIKPFMCKGFWLKPHVFSLCQTTIVTSMPCAKSASPSLALFCFEIMGFLFVALLHFY